MSGVLGESFTVPELADMLSALDARLSDREQKLQVLDGVLQTVAGQGSTVVMTSHDLARAEDLATRFDILSRGVITASSPREGLGQGNLLTFYNQALAG